MRPAVDGEPASTMAAQRRGQGGFELPGHPGGHTLRHRAFEAVLCQLPTRSMRSARFLRAHRRLPRTRRPRTYKEKVNWRILNDRRPELVAVEGKLSAKSLVATRAPEVRVPETLWAGEDPRELAGLDLPDRWVLKPNNSTHLVHFGEGRLARGEAAELADAVTRADWLGEGPFTPGVSWARKWAHRQVERVFLVEEFIGGGPGPPRDLKLFVFSGRMEAAIVVEGRFSGERYRYFDRDWRPLPLSHLSVSNKGVGPAELPAPEPHLADQVARQAELIAGDLDFLRVDLYVTGDTVWFGELTAFSGSSLSRLSPRSFDFEWGEHWSLPQRPAR